MNKDITLEDLGYNELIKHKTYMFYIKPLKENVEYENDEIHLEFNFENKTICKTYGDDNTVCEITVEELQAIYNNCKEIGWLDEYGIDINVVDLKGEEIVNILEQFNKGIVIDGSIKTDKLVLEKQNTKELETYIEDLQHQLEQSKNFIKMIKEESYQSSVTGICDTALEILERGKNGK